MKFIIKISCPTPPTPPRFSLPTRNPFTFFFFNLSCCCFGIYEAGVDAFFLPPFILKHFKPMEKIKSENHPVPVELHLVPPLLAAGLRALSSLMRVCVRVRGARVNHCGRPRAPQDKDLLRHHPRELEMLPTFTPRGLLSPSWPSCATRLQDPSDPAHHTRVAGVLSFYLRAAHHDSSSPLSCLPHCPVSLGFRALFCRKVLCVDLSYRFLIRKHFGTRFLLSWEIQRYFPHISYSFLKNRRSLCLCSIFNLMFNNTDKNLNNLYDHKIF